MEDKVVMILEKANSSLNISKQGDSYILEGTFAEFGKENNNHRIYEEKEYLPHLEALKKKMSRGTLYGELDHPEKFDIQLTKVSHIIESLEYIEDSRKVVGKIKILNTESGKNAKAILDEGGKLSISSRAAGTVNEDKKVKIKKIFTYDLVADPGFESAQLERINESLGYSNDDESLAIYDMTGKYDKNLFLETKENTDKIENKPKNMEDLQKQFVTVQKMNEYSEYIKDKFEGINSELAEKKEENDSLKEEVNSLKSYIQYLSEQTKSLETNYIGYAEYVAETVDNLVNYSENIAEKLDQSISYSENIAESVDNIEQYDDYIAENFNNVVKFNDYMTENINQNIEETQNIIKFTEYIGEMVDSGIQYSEHIAEHADKMEEFANYIAENVDNAISYSEHIVENLKTDETSPVNETKTATEIINNAKTLNERVDSILEAVKKQKEETNSQKAIFPYFNLLNESKQKEFLILEDNKKQEIIREVTLQKPMSEQHFLQIWEEIQNPKDNSKVLEGILNEIPTSLKATWDKLDESTKQKILKRAELYELKTTYQIKDFWQRQRELNKAKEFETINENLNHDDEEKKVKKLGYGNEYLNLVANALDNYK